MNHNHRHSDTVCTGRHGNAWHFLSQHNGSYNRHKKGIVGQNITYLQGESYKVHDKMMKIQYKNYKKLCSAHIFNHISNIVVIKQV